MTDEKIIAILFILLIFFFILLFIWVLTGIKIKRKEIKSLPAIKTKLDSSKMHAYQYHGRAQHMPKRLRNHFYYEGIEFEEDDFVDVVEWIEVELVNKWKGNKNSTS